MYFVANIIFTEYLGEKKSLDCFAMLRGWEMCRNDALK